MGAGFLGILMLIILWPVAAGSWVLVVVLHEFAHFAVAKLIDRNGTYLVSIGFGKQIASFSMWGSTVRLHAVPTSGEIRGLSYSRAWSLWEQVLGVSAGLLVNAVLALASFLLVHVYIVESAAAFSFTHFISAPLMFWGGSRDYLDALPLSGGLLYTFGAVNALVMWFSIIPFKVGSYMSDGFFIVHLVRAYFAAKKKQTQARMED